MKVNLLIDSTQVLAGFINLDPFAPSLGGDKRVKCITVENLDEYVDNGECTELRAMNVLEYSQARNWEPILNNWISKLRKGASISVGCTDVLGCIDLYNKGKMNLDDLNKLLYGEPGKTYKFKKSCIPQNALTDIISKYDLVIEQKLYVDTNFVIKAKKL